MTPAGFPHSDASGSKPVCGYPELIAAYHVLRRLSAPRHPPCTLSSLTKLEILLSQRISSLLTRFSCQRSIAGGADRDRTDDLRLARAALSQLSYSPEEVQSGHPTLVGLGRLELPTSRLSGVRSNQLSYRPRQGNAPIPWKLNRESGQPNRPRPVPGPAPSELDRRPWASL